MPDLFVVWTPASVLTALVGGTLIGFLIVSRFDNPRFDALESMVVVGVIGTFVGIAFWTGQAIETLLSDGPEFAQRVVSRAGLFLLFGVATAIGTGLGVRRHRGTWRDEDDRAGP